MEQTPGRTRYNNHSYRVSGTRWDDYVLYDYGCPAFIQTY